MSLNVFLPSKTIFRVNPYHLRQLQLATRRGWYFKRALHDSKAEVLATIKLHKNAHSIDLVNKRFFSGTAQGGGEDETGIQKVERTCFKLLAKSINAFNAVRTSNEVSVIKATGLKIWRSTANLFRKNVVENDKVISMKNDFKEKLERARKDEDNKS